MTTPREFWLVAATSLASEPDGHLIRIGRAVTTLGRIREWAGLRGEGDCEAAFERMYKAHPRRGNRGIAQQYLAQKVAVGVSVEQIEAMHRRYCREAWSGRNAQFAPHFAQWLLDDGYKYEPRATAPERDPLEDL